MAPQQWFYQFMGEPFGPFTSKELRDLAQNGRLTPDMVVKCEGHPDWSPAAEVEGLFFPEQFDTLRRSNEYRDRKNERDHLPLVTTESICLPTRKISEHLPMTSVRRVSGLNAIKDLLLGLRNVFGGRSKTLEDAFQALETEVLQDMRAQARRNFS